MCGCDVGLVGISVDVADVHLESHGTINNPCEKLGVHSEKELDDLQE